jgi:dienelactone hydrolase
MYFEEKQLLATPLLRAAYSDRTAWLLAEMSRLAYFKFEGSTDVSEFAKALATNTSHLKIKDELEKFIAQKRQLATDAKQDLTTFLGIANFRMVDTFNRDGTQGFLAARDDDKMAVLAFRGTEKDIKDIKTDLKAITIEVGGSKVHKGFYDSLQSIKPEIQLAVDNLIQDGYSLFITGHSLGGALALVATKYILPDSPGACYTFGSPRVASSDFGDDIKTPIYRLVNAADIVPRVPPAYVTHFLISLFEVIHIPVIGDWLVDLLHKIVGYRHHGDMRYLTACKSDYSDLRLISNPTIIDRAFRFIKRVTTNWQAPATDHFIDNYCSKLRAYANHRN